MIKIDLNPLRLSGFFNQIFSLVNAIIIANKINKNVYVESYYPLYNSNTKIDINKILNIEKTNYLIKNIGVKIITKCDNINWDNSKINCLIPYKQSKSHIKIFEEIDKISSTNINLCDTFGIFFARNIYYYKFFYNVLFSIIFSDFILQKKASIMLPKEFKSVHLRLEDDFWRESKEHIIKLFNQEFAKYNKDDNIFISTGLNPNDKYYYILQEILKIYPNSIILSKNPNERDIDAIIDYLICVESKEFLGIYDSTFSEVINYFFMINKKPSKIILF